MNEAIWRLRYTLQIVNRCGFRMLSFGWYCSGEALNDGNFVTDNPVDAADDEMSYWCD